MWRDRETRQDFTIQMCDAAERDQIHHFPFLCYGVVVICGEIPLERKEVMVEQSKQTNQNLSSFVINKVLC